MDEVRDVRREIIAWHVQSKSGSGVPRHSFFQTLAREAANPTRDSPFQGLWQAHKLPHHLQDLAVPPGNLELLRHWASQTRPGEPQVAPELVRRWAPQARPGEPRQYSKVAYFWVK